MRENAYLKSRRYLAEGRLVVEWAGRHGVVATCRGDGRVYRCTWAPGTGWACTCPARGRCAHLLALGSVVAVDLEER
jgi:uncharacterized Zn finger protein